MMFNSSSGWQEMRVKPFFCQMGADLLSDRNK